MGQPRKAASHYPSAIAGLIGQVLIKGPGVGKQQLAIRRIGNRDGERNGERMQHQMAWTEHIDRKLDLGDIRFTASNTLL